MVSAIGSRVTQFGSTQPTEQFNPKQEMQIAQATISGKGDAMPFLPPAAAEPLPYTPGIKVFVNGRTYDVIPSVQKFFKEHPITLPSFSLQSFSSPKPTAPATQGSSAVADRIAQLEKELAGKVESGASNTPQQTQNRINDIRRKIAELKRPKIKSQAGSNRGMGEAGSVIKNAAKPMRINTGGSGSDNSNKATSGLPFLKKSGGGKRPDPQKPEPPTEVITSSAKLELANPVNQRINQLKEKLRQIGLESSEVTARSLKMKQGSREQQEDFDKCYRLTQQWSRILEQIVKLEAKQRGKNTKTYIGGSFGL